jgi:hypothetical protein
MMMISTRRATLSAFLATNRVQVIDPGLALERILPPLARILVHRVQARAQTFRDLADLDEHLLAVRKDDKHVLLDHLIRHRVANGFFDRRRVHEQVSAENTPENTLKDGHFVGGDDTGDELELASGVGTDSRFVSEERVGRVVAHNGRCHTGTSSSESGVSSRALFDDIGVCFCLR